MIEVARYSEQKRKDLFRATSQKMHVHEAVIEKDFWVCWVLDYLFNDCPWKSMLVFKGGTSLSKAYGLIDRFSEDIDLILDWHVIGYSSSEPWEERSNTQQDKFGKQANLQTMEFLAETFTPQLQLDLEKRLGEVIPIEPVEQEVRIDYPQSFISEGLLSQIKLEIGPLAEPVPNEARAIRPYSAIEFPEFFGNPATTVQTLYAERTFWEKATILHQEAHRGPEKPLPPRYSRHYYDLFRMDQSPVGVKALNRPDLLDDVAKFKMRFYRCPWAHYENAKPGTLRLVPPGHHFDELRKDYSSMQSMLFGDVPSFDRIMSGISMLESRINN